MAMNFPDNPSVNDEFTVGDQTWVWTGTTWDTVTLTEYSPSPHATTHELGGSDELTLDPTQVTGLDELNTGTEGFTAVSNGSSGLSYQPVSHNYIINGAMDFDQRKGPHVNPSNGDYTLDRWFTKYNVSSPVRTVSQQEFTADELNVNGFGDANFYLRYEQTDPGSGGTYDEITTRIEDVRTLAGQTVTISFWAKASTSTAMNGVSINQVFGSVGSAQVIQSFSSGFTVGTTWDRYTFTGNLPSVSGKTIGASSRIELNIQFDKDTLDTFDLWGVQLEAGSIATPFKRNANSIAGELQACQRYYYRTEKPAGGRYLVLYNWSNNTLHGILPTTNNLRQLTGSDFGNLEVRYNGTSVATISALTVSNDEKGNQYHLNITVDGTPLTPGEAALLRAEGGNGFIELFGEL